MRARVDGKGRDAESGERRGRHSARADLHWDNISATPRPLRRHAEVCYPELRKIQKAGAAGKFSGWGGGKASRKGTPRFEFLLYSPWSAACIWSSTMHALLSAPPPAAPLRGGGASPENPVRLPALPKALTEASLGPRRGYRKNVPQVTGVRAQVLLGNSHKSALHRPEVCTGARPREGEGISTHDGWDVPRHARLRTCIRRVDTLLY